VDAEKLTNIGFHLSSFFYGPFEFIIGLTMLYWVLGVTFLVGIGLIAFIMTVSYFLTKTVANINKKILEAKDDRMKTTKEMLDIIRFVKISAIEKYFFNKLSSKRAVEVGLYMKAGMYFIGSICLYWITSPLIQSLSFLTYVLLGNQISAEVAFTTMAITSLFDWPLVALPQALTEVVQIIVSLRRI
jgi:ATP-binding cassette, subfamily C (CFTR/MRP), member 1